MLDAGRLRHTESITKCLVGDFYAKASLSFYPNNGHRLQTESKHSHSRCQINPGLQPPNEVLQHGALPCALAADDRYLRQVQVAALADGAEGVLELVDEGNEVFHPPVSHSGTSVSPAGSMLLPSRSNKEPNGSLFQQKVPRFH